MNLNTTYIKLNGSYIPYEIRRNPINIYYFKNIVLNNSNNLSTKINQRGEPERIKEHFLYENDDLVIPSDCNVMFNKYQKQHVSKYIGKKTYIYKIMTMNNIGHFIIDNLYPIIKLIFTDQNMLDKPISALNRNINIIFLKSYSESEKQQTVWKKHFDYLLPFTENKIQFLSEISDKTLFENVILCTCGIGKKKGHSNWIPHENLNENNSIKFCNLVKKIYHKFYNITENIFPKKIIILSRKNAKHRIIRNETQLYDTLNKKYNNVQLIEFEKYRLVDELKLLNNTLIFITPHGAGVISSFFIPINSYSIIFHPKGFPFSCDFPTIYKKFLDRLDINTIQYENTDSRDIDYKNIYINRDKRAFYVNIPEITNFVDEIMKKNE